jgi:hypothetical protein
LVREPAVADETAPAVPEVLGEFGQDRPDEDVNLSFRWHGQEIRVHPKASQLDLMEFLTDAGHLDEYDAAVIPPLMRLVRAYVHPDDWPEFWHLARVKHQRPADFFALVRAVTEWLTDRPTVPLPDSTDGQRTTGQPSTDDSPSASDRALHLLVTERGRPDLGGFVLDKEAFDAAGGDARTPVSVTG